MKLEHESIRRLRLIQILLLIIRTLMILCIILMLARPVIQGLFSWVNNPESTISVILIDDSFSNHGYSDFSLRDDVRSSTVQRILESIHDRSRVVVAAFEKGILYDGLKKDVSFPEEILTAGFSYGDLNTWWKEYSSRFSELYANRELFIISDGQSSSFPASDDTDLYSGWNVYFTRLTPLENNIGISQVEILNDILVTNIPVDIEVTLANNGISNAENVLVQLIINEINVGQQIVSLESGTEEKIRFRTAFHETGSLNGLIELQNDDRLQDNQYYFHAVLPEKPAVRVYSQTVNDALFTRNALDALNRDTELFTVSYYPIPELVNMDLRSVDVLIFQGIRDYSMAVQQKIRTFLQKGGHFIVFPGAADEDLADLGFLGMSKNSMPRIVLEEEAFQLAEMQSLKGLVWQEVFDPEADNPFKIFSYIPQEQHQSAALRLKNRDVVWNRTIVSDGTVDQFGFALDLNWTNFPIKGSFIPFWHLLVFSGEQMEYAQQVETGSGWEGRLPAGVIRENISHQAPDGAKTLLIPQSDGNVQVEKLSQIGYHEILAGMNSVAEFCVNVPALEHQSKMLNGEELKQIFGRDIVFITAGEPFEDTVIQARLGTELWRWFLYLLLFLMIIEMILANEYGIRSNEQ